MNIRTKKIILSILDKPEVTIPQLAQIFNVSERSIRNDIQELNSFLLEKQYQPIHVNQSKSLTVNLTDLGNCLDIINERGFYDYKLSKGERIYVITELLLNEVDYITIADLAEKLFMSVSTVNVDLKELAKFAKKYGVDYKSERYIGIKLEGTEYAKRMLLLEMMCTDTSLTSIGFSRTFTEAFKDHGIDRVNQVLSYFETECKLMLTDQSYKRLNTYLYIMLHRVREGSQMVSFLEDSDELYKRYATELCKYINDEFGLDLTSAEINGVSNMLYKLKYHKSSKVSNDIIRIQFYVNRLIEQLKESIHIDLVTDYLFFNRLCLHVEYMTRQKIQHVVDQRILKDVCDENSEIVKGINETVYILEELLQRPCKTIEKEYIVLHVCAAIERKKIKESGLKIILVSDIGVASSQLLLEKIKNNFDFSIIDILPVHALEQYNCSGIDLILSTVQLHLDGHQIPWEKIQLNFLDEDYSRITQTVNKIKARKNSSQLDESKSLIVEITEILDDYNVKDKTAIIERVKKAVYKQLGSSYPLEEDEVEAKKKLSELLDIGMIQYNVKAKTWQQSIEKSSKLLLDHGYIEQRYITNIINKIETNGPYMVLAPGFAVPHAGVNDGGIKTAFSLIKLSEPVDFNSEFGKVNYVCCLAVTDMNSHLRAFFSLVNLLQNKEFMKKLDKCKNPNELHRLIRKYE